MPRSQPRKRWYSHFARLHPKTFFSLYGLGGVVLLVVLVWAFGAIAENIPEQGRLVDLDSFVVTWIQPRRTALGVTIGTWLSWLGDTALSGMLVALAIGFARARRWKRALTVLVCAGGGAFLAALLKTVFQRGRPEYALEFLKITTWSFPSGHTMDSVVGYGIIAFFILEKATTAAVRWIAVLATVLLVSAIGFSRIYVGAHYLSDVVGGLIGGLVWLMVCVGGYRIASRTLPE